MADNSVTEDLTKLLEGSGFSIGNDGFYLIVESAHRENSQIVVHMFPSEQEAKAQLDEFNISVDGEPLIVNAAIYEVKDANAIECRQIDLNANEPDLVGYNTGLKAMYVKGLSLLDLDLADRARFLGWTPNRQPFPGGVQMNLKSTKALGDAVFSVIELHGRADHGDTLSAAEYGFALKQWSDQKTGRGGI